MCFLRKQFVACKGQNHRPDHERGCEPKVEPIPELFECGGAEGRDWFKSGCVAACFWAVGGRIEVSGSPLHFGSVAPAISIITTVYNRAAFLEAAVRSVRAQTFGDFEHIVFDDGSDDGSIELARRLASEDARVRLIESAHVGVVGALKAAHGYARGRFIGWVDSDDLLVETALEETMAALGARPDAGLVFTDHVLIDAESRVVVEAARPMRAFSAERLLTEFVSFHFRLFRREVFESCGGIDDSFSAAADYDFCLRASEVCRFIHLPRVLYCYRVHGGAISRVRRAEQIENSRRAVEAALRRRGLSVRVRLEVGADGEFVLKSLN